LLPAFTIRHSICWFFLGEWKNRSIILNPAKEMQLPFPLDPNPEFQQYSHPEALVSTQWVEDNLGQSGLVIIECDEDILLFETGHIQGAVKLDWHTELNDPITRDYLDGSALAELLSSKGISREDTLVIYGDKSNWWATYALWVLKLFGHEDVRILDGGRAKWIAEGRALTRETSQRSRTEYPVIERDDSSIRAFREDVFAHFGKPLIDVRSPEEYSGERTHMPSYPEEGALRGGHIPSAASVPWSRAVNEDQTFKSIEELKSIYIEQAGLGAASDVIAYCRIGERSSHTWFVLKYLLGIERVRNYDGSWTEWGSAVRVPIVKGTEPGAVPVGR
jgi:thiosulfate/3-mercaptopyruvate sulfurtransferase